MIVTFVSECEKKAIIRTRQVLDAFANRIGANVWQTVITEEGLLVVKKLLRQTVTKNTAVSCHWVRSRRRSDLLWIVGNRNRFNILGYVPVNITQKELITDEITMKAKKDQLYANTQLQPLAEHLFAVGYLAEQIFKKTVSNDEKDNLANIAYLAGCLHDIGKADPNFQDWLRNPRSKKFIAEDGQHIDAKFTFEKHPRHNEISAILLAFFDGQLAGLNSRQKEALSHVVYWHHAKPFRKTDDFNDVFKAYGYLQKSLTTETFEILLNQCVVLLKRIKSIAEHYGEANFLSQKLSWSIESLPELFEQFEYRYKGKDFSDFKYYSSIDDFEKLRINIEKNAHNNLLRACVISADRLVSKLSGEDLLIYLKEGRLNELLDTVTEEASLLTSHLEIASTQFPLSDRTIKQNQIAELLHQQRDIPVLAGPAGCGKTRIALEWARLQNAKKIIWVCPRVQVCQGIFQELIDSYLPDANVEILTGEFKYTNKWGEETKEEDYFSADVVVTTIDQILGSVVTHTNVNGLIPFMDAHVVFDEYHEYIPMDIFNLLFAELIANKKMRSSYDKRTLLVSATPQYFYLENILGFYFEDVVEMASFNHSQYQIKFIDYEENVLESNPFYQPYSDKTFVISNTAITAQLGFVYQKANENSVLFHSKFKKSDKKSLFNEVYEAFKKDGTEKYQVLRSGPIVQASLNISANSMLTEMTSPENLLQRLGRLDRFGLNQEPNILSVAITEAVKNGSSKGSSAYFLNRLNALQTTKQWFDYIQNQLGENTFSLTELYQLYRQFYATELGKKAMQDDLEKAIKKSIEWIGKKVAEPSVVVKKKTAERMSKMSKNSLRGDSRFVQLAKLDLNDYQNPVFLNEYAYTPPLDDVAEYDNLTESLSVIRDLLPFIAQKHGNVDPSHPVKGIPEKKSSARQAVLEGYAKDADYPLYLSYIEDDLNKVGGVGVRNNHAIYYAVCDEQAIGSMSLDKINEIFHSDIKGDE